MGGKVIRSAGELCRVSRYQWRGESIRMVGVFRLRFGRAVGSVTRLKLLILGDLSRVSRDLSLCAALGR